MSRLLDFIEGAYWDEQDFYLGGREEWEEEHAAKVLEGDESWDG